MNASLVFGAGMVLLGMFWLWHAARGRQTRAAAAAWPMTDGIVIESTVQRGAGSTPVWEARIRYAYHVGDAQLESDRVTLGGRFRGARVRAERRVAKYPVGGAVTVYYDPAAPHRACLEPVHEALWLEVVAGVCSLAGGTLLLLNAL